MSKQQSPETFIELPEAVRARFTLSDPATQPGLTVEMEPGAKPEKYINRYHTSHDVRCAFCAGHTPHRRGFTVQMKDGRIALCGIVCGKHYFGEEAAKGFENALIRTEYDAARDATLRHALSVVPALIRELDGKWLPLEDSLTNIVEILPEFPQSMIKTRINDREEFVISDVETTWHHLPDGGRKAIETEIELGRIKGARLLAVRSGQFCKARADATVVLSGRDVFRRPVSPEARLKKWKSLPQTIQDGLQYLRSAQVFLMEDNIKMLDLACRKLLQSREKCELRTTPKKGEILWVRDECRTINKVPIPDLGALPSNDEFFERHAFRMP
jgi:hypothetical protein